MVLLGLAAYVPAPHALSARMADLWRDLLARVGRKPLMEGEMQEARQAVVRHWGGAPPGVGASAGYFQYFNETLLAALNVADALVSVPRDLAWLFDAAGGLTLDHAGKIALLRALEAPGT